MIKESETAKVKNVDAIAGGHATLDELVTHERSLMSAQTSMPIQADCSTQFHARHSSGERPLTAIKRVVIHCTQGGSAAAAAAWFENPRSSGSAHLVVDDNICYRTLDDNEIPWAAQGANYSGIHVEQAGFVSWSQIVWSKRHRRTLQRAAYKTAHRCFIYRIPVTWLDANKLKKGLAASSTGSVKYDGGVGGAGSAHSAIESGNEGAGGGSSAGSGANGVNGTDAPPGQGPGAAGGVAPANGGNGGKGGEASGGGFTIGSPDPGHVFGGGGGGGSGITVADNIHTAGAAGAAGGTKIIETGGTVVTLVDGLNEYIVPNDISEILVGCWGGGGGGARGQSSAGTFTAGGAGGGGGAFAGILIPVAGGQRLQIEVTAGAGGAGTDTNTGGNGTATTTDVYRVIKPRQMAVSFDPVGIL